MGKLPRPDLSRVDPAVREYIEALEAQLGLHKPRQEQAPEPAVVEDLEPSELATTLNLITLSTKDLIKRAPRHEYQRQRRGGMGIFGLDTARDEQPAILSIADENQGLLIFTNMARAFRMPANRIETKAIHARGEPLAAMLTLELGEYPIAVLPEQATGYVTMVSQTGVVRCLRHHLFGNSMKPGTTFFTVKETGPMVAACWTTGSSDLLIATRKGMAIRFPEKMVNPRGEPGIRLSGDDAIIAVTGVEEDSLVFFAGADGKGTLRSMAGFVANKSPGASGKMAMKTDKLIAATAVTLEDDIIMISALGKIIRFKASEVPTTEGVVQGVICINMRLDEAVTALRCKPVSNR